MGGLLTGKVVEDVTGRAETFPVIYRVDNHTGLWVVRRQNILNLKVKNIHIWESNVSDGGVSYRHFVAGMIYEAQLHLFIVNLNTDRLLAILLIYPPRKKVLRIKKF